MSVAVGAGGEPDLTAILRTYNDVTERLKRSHEALLTDVARLHDEIHEKNRELQRRERLAALGEMAAGLAHEIRNPLGGIGLYASLLEKELVDRPREQHIAGRISAGVQNLEKIVRDILSFAGDVAPRMTDANLGSILDAVLAQVGVRATTQGVEVLVDERPRGIDLVCDPGQIERALLNLVLNALDVVGEGGHVWIDAAGDATTQGLVNIAVSDDGPGIPPGNLHRVFHPFFTTKDHGTGLGLAIVHRIAEAHGGRITARNRREGGACFLLSLPLRCDAAIGPGDVCETGSRRHGGGAVPAPPSAARTPRSDIVRNKTLSRDRRSECPRGPKPAARPSIGITTEPTGAAA